MLKKLLLIISVIITVFTFSTFGNQTPTSKSLIISESTIKTLLLGITSENYGLRTSSAYMLGELKLKEAVIPLMRMLHNEKSEQARIMAAVSLFKIGDARGIFAVKQAIRFDKSERVSKMCEKIYSCYCFEKQSEELLLAGL